MLLSNITWANRHIVKQKHLLLGQGLKRCWVLIQVLLSSILLRWSQVRIHMPQLPRKSLVVRFRTVTKVWGLRAAPGNEWFPWIPQLPSTMGSKQPNTIYRWATLRKKDQAPIQDTWLLTCPATTTPATSPTSRRPTSSWATKQLEQVASFANISNLRVISWFSSSNNRIPAGRQPRLQEEVPWASTKLISKVPKEIVVIPPFWRVNIKENKWFS